MHFALLPIKRVYKLVENGVLRWGKWLQLMCFKWYCGMWIKAVESAFDHPNFDLVLLTIGFELWPFNKAHKVCMMRCREYEVWSEVILVVTGLIMQTKMMAIVLHSLDGLWSPGCDII
jgi:hypothetical protein